jgi:hypothetical protein
MADPEVLAELERRRAASWPETPIDVLLQLALEFPAQVAENPAFLSAFGQDPGLLKNLKVRDRQILLRHVASNPNISIEILLKLATEFPQEVADNPMFLLLFLENPELLQEMQWYGLVQVLSHKQVPSIFIDAAQKHSSIYVQKALLKRSDLSEEILIQMISQVKDRELAGIFLGNPHCTDRVRQNIIYGRNRFLQMVLAEIHLEDDAWLDRILNPENKEQRYLELRQLLTRYKALPWWHRDYPKAYIEKVLDRFINAQLRDIEYHIKIKSALFTIDLHPKMLALLSNDPHAPVRAKVAKQDQLSESILLKLAQDPAEVIQHNLRKNDYITVEQLQFLAQQAHGQIKILLAQHCHTPAEILETLALRPHLQRYIARHPNTPQVILQGLAKCGMHEIELTQNPKIDASIVEPILNKLATHESYTVRKIVARHPNTSRELLQALAQDPEPKVSRLAQQRL